MWTKPLNSYGLVLQSFYELFTIGPWGQYDPNRLFLNKKKWFPLSEWNKIL